MTAPAVARDAYRNRAANTPKPAGHAEHAARAIAPTSMNMHDPETALWLATSAANYFADISEYQPIFDSSYAYPIRMFRCHSGYRIDNHAQANWSDTAKALEAGTARVAFVYPVFVPGQFATVMRGIQAVFGAACPTNRLVPVLDMESGPGFAGPGNHSAEANDWANQLAAWAGTPVDWVRSHGYANNPDYAENWPQIDGRIPKHTAAYNARNPGTFAWQYQGGNPAYPAPAGAPRAYAPFGTYVDGNVIYESLDSIERLLGITSSPTPLGEPDMERIIAIGSSFYRYATGQYMLPIPVDPSTGQPSAAQYALIFDNPACSTKSANLYGNPTEAVQKVGVEVCDQAHFDMYAATIPKPASLTVDVDQLATGIAAAMPPATGGLTKKDVQDAITELTFGVKP